MKSPIRRFMRSGFLAMSVFAAGIAAAAGYVGESRTLLPDGNQLLLGGQGADKKVTAQGRLAAGADTASLTLPAEMKSARSGHTATVLPNGLVLVLGGVGADSRVVESVELFDPAAKSFSVLSGLSLLARTDHSATVMTDGRVLIAGGIGADGRVLREVEVLDTATGKVERINPDLETARFGHVAALLPSSPVLLRGGFDENDRPVDSAELFDPVTQRFLPVPELHRFLSQSPLQDDKEPSVTGGIPPSGAIDFPIDGRISVRFSANLQMTSLNDRTVVLYGPTGVVATNVVPAESGLLVFITPDTELQPGTHYTLFLNGPADGKNRSLPFSAIGFRTAALPAAARSPANSPAAGAMGNATDSAPAASAGGTAGSTGATTDREQSARSATDDGEEWIPGAQHFRGDWRARRVEPAFQKALPKADTGVTALSGLVLRLNGKPLKNATLSIGNRSASTDERGHFLLTGIPAGVQTLVIEGKSANRPDATYGYFESVVRLNAGQTNALPFTIWMPKLDTVHTLKIPAPTTQEVVLSTPRIPGFEVRIPAGVVLRDRQGKVVTEIGITAIPIDRTPFPQPHMDFPVYYTVQPGGVVVQSVDGQRIKPARLIYPNYTNAPPGERADVWLYDPVEKGWYIYGKSTVSADGAVLEPDPGVGLFEFTGGGFSFGGGPNPGPPPCCDPCGKCAPGGGGPGGGGGGGGGGPNAGGPQDDSAGDPVSLSTGLFIYAERDFTIRDIVPLSVERVYRHNNTTKGLFGYGWSSPLDWYLYSVNTDQSKVSLVMPNGTQIVYNLISGTDWTGVYQHASSSSEYYLSTLQSLIGHDGSAEWQLKLLDGRSYNFAHHGARLVRYADRFGNATAITRSVNGAITRITGPSGRYLNFTANLDGTISQISDAIGRTYSYAYQGGYLTVVTDPASGTRVYTYDANNRLRTIQDPTGNIMVTNDYDANGRVMTQTYANSSTMHFAYVLDGSGKITQTNVTDQRGNTRQVNFSASGYITSSTYPFGKSEQQTWTFSRDPSTGRLNSATDPLNRVTSYSYDSKGNLVGITRLAGTTNAVTASYAYEPTFNRVSSVTDALNHTWTTAYDSAGNPVTGANPLGHTTTRTYNTSGQLTSVTDATNRTTTYSYAGADLVSSTDPAGAITMYLTDAVGRRTRVTNSLGIVSRIEHDALDRITKQISPDGSEIVVGYDAASRIASHRDQKQNLTTYTYGPLGLMASTTDAFNQVESTSYDNAGNVIQTVDRKQQVRGWTYDNLNRVTRTGFGALVSAPTAYTSTIDYTFDAADRLTQIDDSDGGTIVRSYDDLNQLVQEQTPEGTVTYTYDAAGRQASMTVAGQSTLTYTWDIADRLIQMSQGSDAIVFTYDDASRRTGTTLANGVVMTYAYDSVGRLASITYSKGGTNIGDLVYSNDASGRRTAISGSLAKVDLPAAMGAASYNANNQIADWGGVAHTHDANGNLTSNGTDTFAWNARDQLASIGGGATASFAYDGEGRRRSKTIGSTQTGFLYDRLNFVQELAGTTVKANVITGGIDEILLRKDAAGTRHPITDALGSVLALTDTAGATTTEYSFEPYGKATVSGQTDTNRQTFTAREDDGTGLYFYRARYYSPQTGRFISEDPIGWESGQQNNYMYVGDDPISWGDPLGLARGGGRPDSWPRPCNRDQKRECRKICSDQGREMASCAVPYNRYKLLGSEQARLVRSGGGISCECKSEPDPEPPEPQPTPSPDAACGKNCQNMVATTGMTATGLLILTIIKLCHP